MTRETKNNASKPSDRQDKETKYSERDHWELIDFFFAGWRARRRFKTTRGRRGRWRRRRGKRQIFNSRLARGSWWRRRRSTWGHKSNHWSESDKIGTGNTTMSAVQVDRAGHSTNEGKKWVGTNKPKWNVTKLRQVMYFQKSENTPVKSNVDVNTYGLQLEKMTKRGRGRFAGSRDDVNHWTIRLDRKKEWGCASMATKDKVNVSNGQFKVRLQEK